MLCLLALLLLPTTAHAASTADRQDITGNRMVTELVTQGYNWWQTYDKHPCPPAKLHIYVLDFNGEGYAEPGCDMYLNKRLWREAQGWPLDSFLLIERRTNLCKVAWHELAHTGGVMHYDNGWLMDSRGLDHMATPARCIKWANGN